MFLPSWVAIGPKSLIRFHSTPRRSKVRGVRLAMIWIMVEVRIASIDAPLLRSAEAASLALSLVGRAQTMGFLPVREGRVELDREFLEELAELLRRRGVALRAAASLAHAMEAEPLNDVEVIDALRAILDAVDASPAPPAGGTPGRDRPRAGRLAR